MDSVRYSNSRLEFEYNDEYYYADVTADGEYYYYAGRMYTKNGDGDPPEEDLTITKIIVEGIEDDYGNTVEMTPELVKAAEDAVYDVEWEEWLK